MSVENIDSGGVAESYTEKNRDRSPVSFPVSRETLYTQVWAMPMTTLGKEYGVSSSYLARICTRLNVPRPERGYWAKLAVGKTIEQPVLPVARPEDELEWCKEGVSQKIRKSLPVAPSKKLRKTARTSPRLSLHRLINGAKAHFVVGRKSDEGYLKPNKKLLADLRVTAESLDSVLNVANQLFLGMEEYGCRVRIASQHERFQRAMVDEREKSNNQQRYENHWSPWRITVVDVGTVAIGLMLFETSEEVEMERRGGKLVPVGKIKCSHRSRHDYGRSWTTTRDIPTGRFCLQAYSPYFGTTWERQWKVPKNEKLARWISMVIRELEGQAKTISDLVREAEQKRELERQRWEAEYQKWEQEEEQRRQDKALADSHDDLLKVIDDWAKIKNIEHFFNEVEKAIMNMDGERRKTLCERLAMARHMVGEGDALESLKAWRTPSERL